MTLHQPLATTRQIDVVFDAVGPKLSRMKLIEPERIRTSLLLAVKREPRILQCTQESVMWAMLDLARMGLEPDGVQAAVVARSMKKKDARGGESRALEASVMAMYRGLIHVAVRDAGIRTVQSMVVYERDTFSSRTVEGNLTFDHQLFLGVDDPGQIVGSYVTFLLANGDRQSELLRRKDLNKIRDVSDGNVWNLWPEEMARKAAIRRGVKYLPVQSRSLVDVVQIDERAEIGMPSLSSEDLGDGDERFTAPETRTTGSTALPRLLERVRAGEDPDSVLDDPVAATLTDDERRVVVAAGGAK